MSVRRLGIGGSVLVLWVVLLGAVAFPALAAAPEAPEVTVESVTATTATLHGVISPKVATFPVEPGTYQFIYRPSTTDECQGAGEILAPASPNVYFGLEVESVFEPVAGLAANTEYAVCLVAETIGGKATSAPVTFTTALPPEAPETSSPAKAITATTAVLEGVLNPHSSAKNGWFFYYAPDVYTPTCPYFESALEPEVTGEKLDEHVEVTGLEPHTKYMFCLVATNAAGEIAQSANEVSFETLSLPPTVLSESSSAVTATAARLEALVNPSNEVTECHFDYGVASASEHIVACEQATLEGVSELGVGVGIAGLTQHTTYKYRVVAKNATGTEEGKEETFGTGTPEPPETTAATEVTSSTAKLNGVLNPKHEGEAGAYEFVYRESKGDCQGEGEVVTPAVAANGLSLEVVSGEVAGLHPGATYTFCLRAVNASSESALGEAVSFNTPPVAPIVSDEFVTNVSSESVTLDGQVNPGGAQTTYRFEYGPSASYGKSIESDAGAGPEAVPVSVHLQGLTPGALYHYRLVASNEVDPEVAGPDQTFTVQPAAAMFALPDGRAWEMVSPPSKEGAEVSTLRLIGGGDMQAAENGEAVTYITSRPISAAAKSNPFEPQVISKRGPDGWTSEGLSVPHNGSSIAEYENSGPSHFAPRFRELEEYMIFSPNLSLAYVEPEGRTPLVSGQPAPKYVTGVEYDSGYVRDIATGTYSITKLSPEKWRNEQEALAQGSPSCDASTSPAKGVGVDAVSRDGCYVYFNSESILAAGATGTDPLYVSHYDGGAWRTTFISSLSGTGTPEWSGRYVELSPNGRYVAFMSDLGLTGYDNHDAITGEPDEEVYLYDAASNQLACVSCNPSGARPMGQLDPGGEGLFGLTGGELLVDADSAWKSHRLAGILPEPSFGYSLVAPLYQPHYLSDSGRLFFDSPDLLVPQDVNGLENVYEYEPKGVGSCGSGVGCLSLISSGAGSKESAFLDASANGNDVFFITSSRLTPQDHDNVDDVYDAHVCSASVPCRSGLVSPPACETSDSCKAPSTPQPGIFGAPPSATFNGAGNVSSGAGNVSKSKSTPLVKKVVKCKKGKRLSHGRCVKKAKAKSKHKSAKGRK